MGAGWVVGVGINLLGSVMINAGTNMMKLGHNKRAVFEGPVQQKPPIYKFRPWQLGVVIFVVGNICNFISFGYAAQSLLAAMGCVQFVSNVVFASIVLKEQVTPMILVSTACIVGGCILLVSFGSHTSSVYTVSDLLRFYGRAPYISYMVVGAVLVAATYALYWKGKRLINEMGAHAPAIYITLLPVYYATFSAVLGTQSVLFSKTLSTLVRATASGDNQFSKWFTWVVLPVFLCSAVFWVTRLNKGLNMFPAMVIVPTMQIAWTLLSIVSGMLYFQEYQGMSALKACMFFLGVAIVFAGVFLLTRSTAQAHASSSTEAGLHKAKASTNGLYEGEEDGEETSRPYRSSRDGLLSDRIGSGVYAGHSDDAEDAALGSTDMQQAGSGQQQEGVLQFMADGDGNGQRPDSCEGVAMAGPLRALKAGSGSNLSRPASGACTPSRQQQSAAATPNTMAAEAALDAMDTPTRARLKQFVSSFHQRMRSDFGLDERTAAKLALGLGHDSMPAMSIYGGLSSVDVRGPARGLQKYDTIRSVYEKGSSRSQQHTPRHDKALQPGDIELGITSATNSFIEPAASTSGGHNMHSSHSSTKQGTINPLSNAIDVFPAGSKEKVGGFMTSVEEAARKVEVAAKKVKSSLKHAPGQLLSAAAGNGLHRGYARMGEQRTFDEEDMQSMLASTDSMEQEPDE